LCGDDPVVGGVSFDGFLIGESQGREEPDDDMGGGKRLLKQAVLLDEWRHGCPMVVHVGDLVGAQDVQVARSQNGGIADFCCVLWSWWQCAEKSVNAEKRRAPYTALKLKNEGPSFDPALLCRRPD
jgi:hypothetical protein